MPWNERSRAAWRRRRTPCASGIRTSRVRRRAGGGWNPARDSGDRVGNRLAAVPGVPGGLESGVGRDRGRDVRASGRPSLGVGRLDAVLSIGGNRPSSLLNVLKQNALGTFNAPVIYPSYDIPEPVEALDMDHDGRADVVTLHGGWQEAGFYAQRLDGTLTVESRFDLPYASHYNPKGLALGDVSGDSFPTSWPRTSATGWSFFARPRRHRLLRHLPHPVRHLRRRLRDLRRHLLRLPSRLRWHRPRHHLPHRPRAVACLESSVASSWRRHGRSGGPAVPWAASVASVRGAGADGSWLSSHVRDGSCRDMAA
jgi:hypothetical protein